MLIDLQLHSTYSDGYLTPTEVAKFLAREGVKIASLTDHNTVGGILEFKIACEKYGIKFITGLELYVRLGNKKFNLIWYNFDHKSPLLHKLLRESQIRRRRMARIALGKLIRTGLKIDKNKILDKYNHYPAVNHMADDIYSRPSNRAKIKKWLSVKNPRSENIIGCLFHNKETAVLHETCLDVSRIIALRKKIGGQLVLNHPAKYGSVNLEFLKKLKKIGFEGLEILSPHHSLGAVMYLQQVAEDFKFIETGGSDFHLNEGGKWPLQNSWQYFKIDSKYLRGVEKITG
jgi:hypothetical protein